MPDDNKNGLQKPEQNTANTAKESIQSGFSTVPTRASTSSTPQSSKGKARNRRHTRSQIGGTAVPGAKSTQPKPPPTSNNPQQQQAETSNRTMRRRMEQLGTAPEDRAQTLHQQRRKRIERQKQRVEEHRQELRKAVPGGKITLGRRNTYFLIGVAILIVLLIIFGVLRFYHIL